MTKAEALELAAMAHKNLHDRLGGIDAREQDLSWSQEKCKAQRDLAYAQYIHTIDNLTVASRLTTP